jgi:hypothetical protein
MNSPEIRKIALNGDDPEGRRHMDAAGAEIHPNNSKIAILIYKPFFEFKFFYTHRIGIVSRGCKRKA